MIPKGLEDGKPFPTADEMRAMMAEADSIREERRLTTAEKDTVFHGAVSLVMFQLADRSGYFYELVQPYLAEMAQPPGPRKRKSRGSGSS
jgi:hypothetical protein